ncbi:MAG: calcium-binding protein [Pseudomonadota bacterium]
MTNKINYFYNQAELALAAYSDFSSVSVINGVLKPTEVKAQLVSLSGFAPWSEKTSDFSNIEADKFLERFDVLDQYTDNTLTNGFSATVFRDKATGQIHFVNRGTNDLVSDIVTDAKLALGGKPLDQIVSMVNYFLRVKAGADNTAQQIEAVLPNPVSPGLLLPAKLATFRWTASVAGTGPGIGDASIIVAGHSLGGYLSTIFGYLFGSTVSEVNTYNAPGSWGIDLTIRSLAQLLGNNDPSYIENRQNNLIGDYVVSGVPGHRGTDIRIFEEGSAHSQKVLADSLALQNMLATLSPDWNTNTANETLKASSNIDGDSLEQTLDALRKLLLGSAVVPTKIKGADDSQASRENFYKNLYDLMGASQFKTAANNSNTKIISLTDLTFTSLVNAAKSTDTNALAYRYSLQELNSFVILGVDYSIHNSQGQLELYNPNTSTGTLTDKWLQDRAEFLNWKNEANTDDLVTVYHTGDDNWQYGDVAQGYNVNVVGKVRDVESSAAFHKVIFGGADVDTLTGGVLEDHLYGGTGGDTLKGGKGNDYLEGGAGGDSYIYEAGDGWDTIRDTDGKGAIQMNGFTLSDGKETTLGSGIWQSTDKQFQYTQLTETDGTKTLVITNGADRIYVKDFTDGELNLRVTAGTAPIAPVTNRTIVGDLQPIDVDLTQAGVQLGYDSLGNVLVNTTALLDRTDKLFDSAGDDLIQAKGGNDDIFASRGGNDRLDAGNGNDLVTAGTGDDIVIGGVGEDRLFGEADNDRLYALTEVALDAAITQSRTQAASNVKGDWIDGGTGDDIIVGDAGNDALMGGDGKDILVGGGGDDNIYADANTDATPNWTIARSINTSGDLTTYTTQFTNAAIAATPGAADLIYGGAGDDWVRAGGGNDIAYGEDGKDVLFGDTGDDILLGGTNDDVLSGDVADDGTTNGLAGSLHGQDYIDGGTGNDKIFGNGRDDTLLGGIGDDEISGDDKVTSGLYHGSDYLDGEDGNDKLWGGGSDDTLFGGIGNDYLEGDYDANKLNATYHGDDYLDGEDGNDSLLGDGGNDELFGGAGDDILEGDGSGIPDAYQGADYLDGGDGQDSLAGGGGADTLIGGANRDNLDGGAGDDLYIIGATDALVEGGIAETIADTQGNDSVELDVTADQLDVYRDGDDLHLQWAAGTQALVIENGVNGAIENFTFADGKTLTATQLLNNYSKEASIQTVLAPSATLIGSAVGDSFTATGGHAEIHAGLGNDNIIASGGNNNYYYGIGDGADFIQDTSAKLDALGNAQPNTLKFGAGITANDIQLVFLPNVFPNHKEVFAIRFKNNTSDEIRISPFDSSHATNSPGIDRFEFSDGTVLNWATLVQKGFDIQSSEIYGYQDYGTNVDDRFLLGHATYALNINALAGNDLIETGNRSDTIDAGDGNDTLLGKGGNDWLYGGVGDDLLDGGADNDMLYGNDGADTYVLAIGCGQDTVENRESVAGAGADVISVAAGLTAADLVIQKNGEDLVIRLLATGEGLTITNHYFNAPIDGLRFADNTFWTRAQLEEMAAVVKATEANDTLSLSDGDDVFNALGGNDSISGMGGNDDITGGAGADSLDGGEGNDRLVGGTGNDILIGGNGSDVYRYNLGDGYDQINEDDSSEGRYDVLEFGAGITTNDVKLSRVTGYKIDYLDILVPKSDPNATKAGVKLAYAFGFGAQLQIDAVRFADGAIWTFDDIKAKLITPTTQRDFLIGFESADTMHGDSGDDVVDGYLGNDTLFGDDGADTLYGSGGDDSLLGGAGDDVLLGDSYSYVPANSYGFFAQLVPGVDTLDGGIGNDRLEGGAGADTYIFGRGYGHDTIFEGDGSANGGSDTIALAAGIAPANVTLIRTSDDSATGPDDLILVLDNGGTQLRIKDYFDTTADRRIEKISFADGTTWDATQITTRTLDQRGTANAVVGTSGNDTFTVDHPNDTISELSGGGIDTVNSSVGYTLSTNVENLNLTGILNIDGTGNSLNNTIRGNSSDNVLDGKGGTDTLIGGKGDDTYVIGLSGAPSSLVVEAAGEGIDTVINSNNTYTLADNVENLIIPDMSYSSAGRYLKGNALDNTISVLTQPGFYMGIYQEHIELDGGLGADILIGGRSWDTYVLDNTGDKVIEGNNYGSFDTVNAPFDYTLGANLEALVLTGTTATRGWGNDLNNLLDGSRNSAANLLTGGKGSDKYIVGIGDTVVENDGEGDDTVEIATGNATTSYISSYANVENIRLLNNIAVSNIVGNEKDNVLVGNDSNNVIVGGAGNDTLYASGGYADSLYSGYTGSRSQASSSYLGTDTLDGGDGNDVMYGGFGGTLLGGSGNDTIYAGYGANTIDGGAGNDFINSNNAIRYQTANNDVYLFGRGSGADTIEADEQDVVRFVANVSPDDVLLSRVNDDLVVNIAGTADKISVSQYFYTQTVPGVSATPFRIGQLQFDDGTVWNASAISARVTNNNSRSATESADTLTGTALADTIDALGGNDTLWSGLGNDTLKGGVGADVIYAGDGDDILVGGADNDSLYAGAGNDTLAGGAGDDFILDGGAGSDTYLFARGDGTDGVRETGSLAGDKDVVLMAADLLATDITVSDGFGFVTLSINGTSDSLYTNDQIEEVRFADGTVWNTAALKEMAAIRRGTSGDDGLMGSEQANSMYGFDGNDYLAGLGGADSLYGGNGNDTLDGGEGDNLIDGGSGADVMYSGGGNDTFVVDNVGDVVNEVANAGTDTVLSSINWTLGANLENLTLTGVTALNGTGNTLNNVIIGNSANNILDGGKGTDTLQGALGDDTYKVDATTDVIIENANEGTDSVQSAVTYTLSANVENLTLTGSTAINGTGNGLNNTAGADTMIGGAGNDSYTVDNTGDVITENANEGTDAVQSSVTYTLSANVENLTLAGTSAINATGNGSDNVITGNSAINTLSGGAGNDTLNGGTGADKMLGGAGNDIYVVDNTADVITENLSEGTDIVQSSVTYALGSNLENMTLTGTSAINGTGNTLDNVLIGNSAINTLTGNAGNDRLDGGAGADKLIGGIGNDTYVVDNTGDVITENASEGTDTVESNITYTLGSNLENLLLTGTSAINGTGNTLNNLLTGNSAINTLNGGAGNDIMQGGAGADILIDTAGNNLFNGGSDNDTLTGGTGNELYIGGTGNDSITTNTGKDVISFNKGDGQDTIVASTGLDNTISLGGGIRNQDLLFSKSGNDLILNTGGADTIKLANWYAATTNHSVVTLQMITEAMADYNPSSTNPLLNHKVDEYNFDKLVSNFDAARAANSAVTTWALSQALLNAHLSSSDSAAIGGDLAYQYGKSGNLASVGLTGAQNVLGNTQLGSSTPQAFQTSSTLQGGVAKLN